MPDYIPVISIDTSSSDAPEMAEVWPCAGILGSAGVNSWLYEHKELIGWTYSFNIIYVAQFDFKRVIAAKSVLKYRDPEVRIAANNHIKCYIGRKGKKHEMLIGSFNLTSPTIEDLCVIVKDKTQIAHMKKEFELCWRSLA